MTARVLAVLFCLIGVQSTAPLHAQGPGLPQNTYAAEEVYSIIGRIHAENGAPLSHGSMSMHNGYLVVVYARGSGKHDGGFAFYDISDPYNPVLVARKDDDETFELREAHGYGYSNSYGGNYVALQAIHGIQFWDWTDINNPVRLSYLELPGISESDYSTANWWTFWQAPYVYVAGTSNGLYIVDAHDPRNPVLVDRGDLPNPIPISQTGGFRIGSLFAVGNLLVVAGNDVSGYATLDISDPINPVLLAAETDDAPDNYSAFVNGNRIYGAGRFREMHVHDISDPSRIAPVAKIGNTGDKGGYISYQDGFVHMGASTNYVKIDVRDDEEFQIVGTVTSGIDDADEDFATVLGNLVILSDDHDNGSFIIPHQSAPDTRGPAVNMVSPADGASHQKTTTRIGLTFTDLIDLRSVNRSTVIVRPFGGDALTGKYSHQTNIVNFTPDQPLQPDTIYEIVVPAGGVRDVAGNPTEARFSAYFSTGASTLMPPTCAIDALQPVPVGQEAVFDAQLLSGNGAILYSWEWGDGTLATPFSMESRARHIYRDAGHFNVQLTVRNDELSSKCVARQTVHHPLVDPRPVTASTIILDRSGDLVWNVNPDNNTISAVEAITLTKVAEHPVGPHPTTLAQMPDGALWVVNRDNATISVVEPGGDVIPFDVMLPSASQPQGIVISPDGHAAYVTLQATGQLAKIDMATRTLVDLLDVGPTPRGLAMTGDASRIYVTRFISPDDRGEVVEVDARTFRVTARLPLHFDPGPDTESSGRGVPNGLHSLTISPDARRLWVPSKKDNIARGGARDGQSLTFDSTVRTIVSQIDLAQRREDLTARHDFEDRSMAVAVAFSPLGDYAFVALQGSDAVAILDAYSGQLVTTLDDVGHAPAGLVLSADGQRLFIHTFLSRAVAVYDIHNILNNDIQFASPLATVPVVAHERLSPTVLQGKRLFYSAADPRLNRDGYISCAACHLDEADDGRVWDRTAAGEGFRNTISLLGRGGVGQGVLHWSANFDEVQDFEHDIRTLFGGAGLMDDADFVNAHPLGAPKAGRSRELDALAAFVASLRTVPTSPHRQSNGALTPDAEAGRELFRQLGCADCHGGPQFTDSPLGLRHDVGTLRATSGARLAQPLLGLDTPTLRGLWQSAPYLHDGSAPTLRHVLIDANPAGLHGATAALSITELEQLIAYLQQIDDLEPDAPAAQPIVRLREPTDGRLYESGAEITLRVDTPASVTPHRVEFYANDSLLGVDDQPPFTYTWRPPEGEHRLTALAIHTNGVRTISAEVRISVGERTGTPTPTAPPPSSPTPTPTPVASPTPVVASPPLPAGYADMDADGVADADEDRNQNGNPLDDDTDADGIPDFQDRDDDGDGVSTRDERSPVVRDTDRDGVPDYLDADDDNDGWATRHEGMVDSNNDGTPDYLDPSMHPSQSDTLLFLPIGRS